jgi:hypothetical protein
VPHPAVRLASVALAFAALAAPLAGCFPMGGNAASQIAKAPTYDPPGQAKCGVRKSADHPLIVEWPSADRATLEAKAQSGLVAVRYVGCEMEVLHRCKLPGKYSYTSITPKHDAVTIKDSDDLYANMPVGAAKLEGKLEKSGQLNVSMTIVGRFEADHTTFTPQQLDGDDCDRATHVVSGMTTGAFELSAGASASIGGGVSALGMGAGGKSSSSHETLERDGREEKCEGSSRSSEPPDGCGAVLRLDLVPLEAPKREHKAAVAAEAVEENGIAPNLYEAGNVRVAAHCAEGNGILTPENGLRLVLDGKSEPEKALKSNTMSVMGSQVVNKQIVPVVNTSVIDVGFLVPPGPHHLSIQAPDCVTVETDAKVSGTHETDVVADLEVSSDSLKGPVGAPAGGALLLGGLYGLLPTALTKTGNVTSIDGSPSLVGGVLSYTLERRNLFVGFDYAIARGGFSGYVSNGAGATTGTTFTGSQFDDEIELRIGARLPLRYLALMAGSGIGGSMWISSYNENQAGLSGQTFDNTGLEGGIKFLWHLPLWAGINLKPTCDFGVQVTTAYNWDPTESAGSYPVAMASLMWQPSPSCSRTASVNVSPP